MCSHLGCSPPPWMARGREQCWVNAASRVSRPPSLAGASKFGMVGNCARLDAFADSAACCDPQVVVILQIEPELRGQAEVLSQPEGRVGTDSAVSADDLVDP